MSEILTLELAQPSAETHDSKIIGQIGEDLAARFIVRRGFRLVCSNFKVPVGRNRRGAAVTGEIDLIALDADVLCFFEVKTRRSDDYATPETAVDLRKQRQITRTARIYRRIFGLQAVKFRYDIVAIVLKDEKSPKIEHFKNFWTEEKFRKKFWNDEIW
jgi:putative endonuclease